MHTCALSGLTSTAAVSLIIAGATVVTTGATAGLAANVAAAYSALIWKNTGRPFSYFLCACCNTSCNTCSDA